MMSKHIMMTFENNGINYRANSLSKAEPEETVLGLNKPLKETPKIFGNRSFDSYGRLIYGRTKTRLLVKKGNESFVLRLGDIVLLYTQNKLVFVIDQFTTKYICDKSLGELEEQLDSTIFFRANRQYLVNINYIRSFKPHERVKLLIGLTIPQINHLIVISQETAPLFKKWMSEA
jgi:two-component system, LytTR family, response regulator